MLTDEQRRRFDETLEEVLAVLPDDIHRLLEEIPLIVEDYPSDEVMESVGVADRGSLYGLHWGIPLTRRSVWHSGTLPDTITIYRQGIYDGAADRRGVVNRRKLRRQIRITVLHEIGHHFGLNEKDLRRLGYG